MHSVLALRKGKMKQIHCRVQLFIIGVYKATRTKSLNNFATGYRPQTFQEDALRRLRNQP